MIQRDRHAELMTAMAITASTLDKIATEIRHLARTEVREVQEPFAEGQKGSSAMPHKRNPVVSERVSGLARVIRGYAQAALENVPLWHERDISHSSAERMIFPDATGLLAFMLRDLTWVLDGLHVFPDRMRENLEVGGGVVYSPVGAPRVGRRRAVTRRGLRGRPVGRGTGVGRGRRLPGRAGGGSPRSLGGSTRPRSIALFDPSRYLANLGGVFEKLEKLPVEAE